MKSLKSRGFFFLYGSTVQVEYYTRSPSYSKYPIPGRTHLDVIFAWRSTRIRVNGAEGRDESGKWFSGDDQVRKTLECEKWNAKKSIRPTNLLKNDVRDIITLILKFIMIVFIMKTQKKTIILSDSLSD